MKTELHFKQLLGAMLGGLAFMSAAAQAGTANVSFDQPEKFTDARRTAHSAKPDPSVLDTVRKEFESLAARELTGSQTLDITVTDIDLAGEFEPWFSRGGYNNARIMRAVGWPSMDVRYVLRDGDQVIHEGKARIADLDYLQEIALKRNSLEPMASEKLMMDRWFREEIRPVATGT
jgi:hypothetical protein